CSPCSWASATWCGIVGCGSSARDGGCDSGLRIRRSAVQSDGMEHGSILLAHAMLYLAAAVIAAVVAHRFGLASVAGYLIAVVAGAALTLSSTALALQPLTERGALGSRGGQATFAVLLFQDIAAIPMLALLPLMSLSGGSSTFSWTGLAIAAVAIVATLT